MMMMNKLNGELERAKFSSSRRTQRGRAQSHIRSCGIALMLFAISTPSFAGEGPVENIAIALSNSVVASPAGTGRPAGAVPGAMIDFSVSVSGPTQGGSPATSFAITDMVPEHLSLFVGDLAQAGTGPAAFMDNDSGLSFTFDGLDSATDSIEFSSDGGISFDYVPVADADGFDPDVTHIKLRPRGDLLPTDGKYERFSMRYRMRVK